MRIAVDLTPIFDHLTGIERYNINIIHSMINQHPEDTFILVFKNEVYQEFDKIVERENIEHVVLKSCHKLWFLQYRLNKAMNHINADYYLFLSFTSPLLFRKKKTVSAIHDLTCWDCPESIPFKMKYYYRWTYKASVKKDWRIITVSGFSQKRICEKYKLDKKDVPIIYDGLSKIFMDNPKGNIDELCKKYSIPSEYILSLSTIEPRKNLQLLIAAYQELIRKGQSLPDLVLAGRKGWKLEGILKSIDDCVKERIHFTGFVDDLDLPRLYGNARLFIFPSKYEGFGLPLIEAMSQETLVLSSDAASLPEVIGDSGFLFKSDNKKDLMDKMIRCMELSASEVETKTKKARTVSMRYNWDNEAEKLHSILVNG